MLLPRGVDFFSDVFDEELAVLVCEVPGPRELSGGHEVLELRRWVRRTRRWFAAARAPSGRELMAEEEAGRAQVVRATRPSDVENMAAVLGVVWVDSQQALWWDGLAAA